MFQDFQTFGMVALTHEILLCFGNSQKIVFVHQARKFTHNSDMLSQMKVVKDNPARPWRQHQTSHGTGDSFVQSSTHLSCCSFRFLSPSYLQCSQYSRDFLSAVEIHLQDLWYLCQSRMSVPWIDPTASLTSPKFRYIFSARNSSLSAENTNSFKSDTFGAFDRSTRFFTMPSSSCTIAW